MKAYISFCASVVICGSFYFLGRWVEANQDGNLATKLWYAMGTGAIASICFTIKQENEKWG